MLNSIFFHSQRVMLLAFVLVGFSSCVTRSDYDNVMQKLYSEQEKCDSLQAVIKYEREASLELNQIIVGLRDTIVKLQYPADRRLARVKKLIKEDSLDLATVEIENLQLLFPYSKEASTIHVQTDAISKRKTEIHREQERIKAQGFKVLKDKSTVVVNKTNGDEVKYTFSNFYFDRDFYFNYIDDIGEQFHRTANKENIYLLADLSIYTKSDYAFTPSVYACAIVDGKLSMIGYFCCEYESYETYGAYLGNYSETSHDFSKVNTVKYNMGAEISKEQAKHPIVILMIKDENLGSVNGLTVADVIEKCEVIRIINRAKL